MDETSSTAPPPEPGHGGNQRREALERLRRSRKRTYYSIGEVCSMVGIKPHVLRYWETQFEELSPAKNRSGNRVYQAAEIELIALIQRLVHEERYTVQGARMRIAELRAEGSSGEKATEALRWMFLRALDDELREIHDLLDPVAVSRPSGDG